MAGLDDGLGLAEDGEVAVGGVADTKLLWDGNYGDGLAVADEYAGLGGTDEDVAVLAAVDVHAGVGVEQQYITLLTICYLELLHNQLLGLLNFRLKPPILEQEILPIKFLPRLHLSIFYFIFLYVKINSKLIILFR